jgi:uncharacterized delta-60 repeat protein
VSVLRAALATAALAAALAGAAGADPGDLDPSFNSGTILLLDLSEAGATGTALSAAQFDAQGRIVVAGSTLDENLVTAAALARLLPTGVLDAGFGEGGKLVTQAGRGTGTVFSLLGSLAARPGGGWAATGGASDEDGRQAALALAVDDAGDLDPGFGTGGTARVQPAGPPPAFTLALAGNGGRGGVDANGNVVLAHAIALDPMDTNDTRLAVVRLAPGGVPDGGFATAGVYTNTFSQAPILDTTHGMAALPTPEGVLVAGSTRDTDGATAFLLVRLTAGGLLDPGFADGAGFRVVQASHPAAAAKFSQGVALARGPGGFIYVAGAASDANSFTALAVARFTASGAIDASYGSSGVARLQTGPSDPGVTPSSFAGAVAVQSDGKAVVVGSSGTGDVTEMVVVRFTTEGAVDSTFGTAGVVRLQPAGGIEPETRGLGATIAPDGNTLLAVGQVRQAAGGRGVVARIQLTDVLPDPCFPPHSVGDVVCRLVALRIYASAVTPESVPLRKKLVRSLVKSEKRVTVSANLARRRQRKKLGQALRLVRRFEKQVGSRGARKVHALDERTRMLGEAGDIELILIGLRAP